MAYYRQRQHLDSEERKILRMNAVRVAIAASLVVILLSPGASANACKAKKIKVTQVCGIVVDGRGLPLSSVTLQLVSADGEALTSELVSPSDGAFSFESVPQHELFLKITDPQHCTGRWPLEVAAKARQQPCRKPLVVHQAGAPGVGCGCWVDTRR
jgi:hypothetical protein